MTNAIFPLFGISKAPQAELLSEDEREMVRITQNYDIKKRKPNVFDVILFLMRFCNGVFLFQANFRQ